MVLEAQDVFSVGSISGEEWETFSRIAAVAFDEEGDLYLLDADNFRVVKVAGDDGGLVTEMGGEGDGPGEFGMPMALSLTRAGEVRVFDFGYGGFVRFDADGGYLGSVPMDPEAMIFPSGALLSHPEGGVLSAGGGLSMRRGSDGPEFPTTRPVQLFTLGDEIGVTSVYEGWNPATADGEPALRNTGGGGIQIQAPPMRAFDPELMVGILSDGRVAVADSTTYQVKILDLTGTVQDVIHRPFEPRPVTEVDRDAERERQLAEMTSGEGPRIMMRTDDGSTMSLGSDQVRAMFESRIEGMEFASEMPLIVEMAVDWEDHIWVKRNGPSVGEEGPLDVLTAEGEYLGTLGPGEGRIPDAFGPGGLAAFIELDELDVPRVVVKKLSIR